MSAALSALKSGQPAQALQLLQQEVRQRPDDPKLRIFLFQLLAVLGQWDRALTQLNVSGELDAGALAMVAVYRDAIRCERWREEAFAGKRPPLLFGAPEPWMALLIEALARDAAGGANEAAALRAEALEQAPATSGRIGDETFAWLADADPRFGPMLELFTNTQYYWVPVKHVVQLTVSAPADLRDQVWIPATLRLTNGGELIGLMPARYPGTVASGIETLLLGRRTDWVEHGDVQIGLGQRLFATDAADYALLETRSVVFDNALTASADAAADTDSAGAPAAGA